MKICFLYLFLIAPLVLPALGDKEKNAIPVEVLKALQSPDKVILYSLEPWDQPTADAEKLYQYKILGHAELDTKQAAVAVEEFKKAVDGWDGVMAFCFDPRHALRVSKDGHTYDLLLCFACHQLHIYRDSKSIATRGVHGSSKVLGQLLTELKVPLSTTDTPEGKIAFENEKSKNNRVRWVDGMPASIKPLWNWEKQTNSHSMSTEASPIFRAALAKEFPDKVRRIRALFRWFGSGGGIWQTHGTYEIAPEFLLLEYETADLITAAKDDQLTEPQIEGAARLFAGWIFDSKGRMNGLKSLPADLKKKLLDHSLKGTIEQRLTANTAFK